MKATPMIVLVGCVETKAVPPDPPPPWPDDYLPTRLPAKDLYVSPLFRKRRAYAERAVRTGVASHWAILSALHKCLPPDRVVGGYDWKMSDLSKSDREDYWGSQVAISLRRDIVCDYGTLCDKKPAWQDAGGVWRSGHVKCTGCVDGAVVEIHAGAVYVECARPHLEAIGCTVEAPLAGLQIGEQLAWYKRTLDPQMTLAWKQPGVIGQRRRTNARAHRVA